jgi:hypothetical protein
MAITPNPAVTPLPTAPQRLTDAPAVFVPKADAMMAALPAFSTQISAVGAAAQANGTAAETAATSAEAARVSAETAAVAAVGTSTLMSTCSNSVTLSAGAKSLTGLQSGRTFVNGQRASLVRASDPTSQGSGIISGFSGGTTLTLTIDTVFGATGPFTDWLLVLSVFAQLPAPTTTEFSSAKNFALNAAVIF